MFLFSTNFQVTLVWYQSYRPTGSIVGPYHISASPFFVIVVALYPFFFVVAAASHLIPCGILHTMIATCSIKLL